LDAHYEAVYHPTSKKFDGRLRKIEVKLARKDLLVESRTGYFAMPDLKGAGPLTPAEATGLAVLSADPRPHSFDFHVSAYHFQAEGANSRGTLAFELPGGKLGASADPARKLHKFEVSLFALIRDANGEVVDKYSVDQPYFIADANLAAVRATSQTYTHPVDLPPGHYTVEAAVVDREGSQATAETAQVDIPAPSKGVGISSLVVVEHMEPANAQADPDPLTFKGKHVVPMVEATVNPANKRYVYFVVYPDKSNAEKPKFTSSSRLAGRCSRSRRPIFRRPTQPGRFRCSWPPPRGPATASYRLPRCRGRNPPASISSTPWRRRREPSWRRHACLPRNGPARPAQATSLPH
jgi:hypothetical protein